MSTRLAAALRVQRVPAATKTVLPADDEDAGGVCFQRAEIYDVVHERSGAKIAGAAQKRNKHGLLFQGSVWRPAIGDVPLDWDAFHENFVAQLAGALGATAEAVSWPEFDEDEMSGLADQYTTAEWLEFR